MNYSSCLSNDATQHQFTCTRFCHIISFHCFDVIISAFYILHAPVFSIQSTRAFFFLLTLNNIQSIKQMKNGVGESRVGLVLRFDDKTLWKEDLRWYVLRKQISLQRMCMFPSPFFSVFVIVCPCCGAADYSGVPVFPLATICWESSEVHVKTEPQPDAGAGEGTPAALHIH